MSVILCTGKVPFHELYRLRGASSKRDQFFQLVMTTQYVSGKHFLEYAIVQYSIPNRKLIASVYLQTNGILLRQAIRKSSCSIFAHLIRALS